MTSFLHLIRRFDALFEPCRQPHFCLRQAITFARPRHHISRLFCTYAPAPRRGAETAFQRRAYFRAEFSRAQVPPRFISVCRGHGRLKPIFHDSHEAVLAERRRRDAAVYRRRAVTSHLRSVPGVCSSFRRFRQLFAVSSSRYFTPFQFIYFTAIPLEAC